MHRLVIALTALITLTAGTYLAGYAFLFSASTDRASTLVPADAALYVNVRLQPSAAQQRNLADLLGRLPGFADEATLEDKIDQVVQNLVAGAGLDYRADLKPWLGDQVAIAAWPTAEAPAVQRIVWIVEVTDLAAMEEAMAGVIERRGESLREESYEGTVVRVSATTAYAVVEEMLVVSDAVDGVHATIDTARGAPALAGRADFRASMAALPDHLAAAFVDLGSLAAATDGEATGEALLTTVAAALVAEREGLRLTGSIPREPAAGASGAPGLVPTEPTILTEWMPADTIAEVVVFGLRGLISDAEEAAAGTPQGQEVADALSTLRAIAAFGLGISLDQDVLPLLDREVGIALTGIDGGAPRGQLLLRPTDPEAGAAALERMADALVEAGGSVRREAAGTVEITVITVPQAGEVAYASRGDVLILGLTAADVRASLEAQRDGESLATSGAYRSTLGMAGDPAGPEAYADVGAVLEAIGLAETLPADARAILSQVGGFAFVVESGDDQIEFHGVLTIDEAGAE